MERLLAECRWITILLLHHLVEADSEQDIDYIEEALNHLGFLVKE